MAELADAIGSGPIERNLMEVQILLAAPVAKTAFLLVFAFFKAKNYALAFVFATLRPNENALRWRFVATFFRSMLFQE